jgi:hypothetical protein
MAAACALLFACGGDADMNQPLVGAGTGADAGAQTGGQQGGGAQNPMGGGTQQPGGTTAGTSTNPATMGGGTTAGTAPAVPPGPVDLGQHSEGDTFYRADTLVLKSPNLYATLLILRADVTADGQNALNTALTADGDADGFVDMSMLLRFLKTANPKGANGQVTPGGALCPMPLGPEAACGPEATFPFQTPALEYANATSACALAGTQESAPAPCFVTTPASLTMQLPILGAVPLQDGQIVGSWDGANIGNGFVRGFLPKTVAAATKLGEGLPEFLVLAGIKAGAPLSNFLSDAQLQKNARGEDGWWFLMSYTAKAAKFNPGP